MKPTAENKKREKVGIIAVLFSLYFKYKEYVNYIFFGGLTTFISLMVYTVFTRVVGWGELPSNVPAWVCAVTFAFITNRKWVFEENSKDRKLFFVQLTGFYLSRLSTLFLENVIMWLGVYVLGLNEGVQDLIVKIIANVFVLLGNYLLSKLFIFRKKSEKI